MDDRAFVYAEWTCSSAIQRTRLLPHRPDPGHRKKEEKKSIHQLLLATGKGERRGSHVIDLMFLFASGQSIQACQIKLWPSTRPAPLLPLILSKEKALASARPKDWK